MKSHVAADQLPCSEAPTPNLTLTLTPPPTIEAFLYEAGRALGLSNEVIQGVLGEMNLDLDDRGAGELGS